MEIPMPTEIRKRRSQDAYLDDDSLDEHGLLRDGRSYRTPLMLADSDSGAFIVDSHATPPRRSPSPPLTMQRGYLAYDRSAVNNAWARMRDSAQDLWRDAGRSPTKVGSGTIPIPPIPTKPYTPLPRGEDFPTQSGGTWPAYNNQIGAACVCEDGREGRLAPHPSTSSMLICQPLAKDSLPANDRAYYQMCDEAVNAWRVGKNVPVHDCGCGGRARDQEGTVGFLNTNQVEWPQGGQVEGGECTINGAPGRYVKRNGKYVCEARQDMDRASVDARDPEAVREAAWRQSVTDAGNAWRSW
jgi:hypothetical protein